MQLYPFYFFNYRRLNFKIRINAACIAVSSQFVIICVNPHFINLSQFSQTFFHVVPFNSYMLQKVDIYNEILIWISQNKSY